VKNRDSLQGIAISIHLWSVEKDPVILYNSLSWQARVHSRRRLPKAKNKSTDIFRRFFAWSERALKNHIVFICEFNSRNPMQDKQTESG
jgi:hypothetical protein